MARRSTSEKPSWPRATARRIPGHLTKRQARPGSRTLGPVTESPLTARQLAMLLRSFLHDSGEQFLDVSGQVTRMWGAERVESLLDILGAPRLWAVEDTDGQPSPFVSGDVMRRLVDLLMAATWPLHAPAVASAGERVTVTLRLSLDSASRVAAAFPPSWTVRDALVGLAARGQLSKSLIGAFDAPDVAAISVDSGEALKLSTPLALAAANAWALVSTKASSFCILRGFPWTYQVDDVLEFLWRHGMARSDVVHVWLESSRRSKQRFCGNVVVALSGAVSLATCAARMHHRWAGPRYIEVMQAVRAHCGAGDALTRKTSPLWWPTGASHALVQGRPSCSYSRTRTPSPCWFAYERGGVQVGRELPTWELGVPAN